MKFFSRVKAAWGRRKMENGSEEGGRRMEDGKGAEESGSKLPSSKITAEEMQGFLDGRAETAGNRGNEGEDGEWRMEDGKDARESGSRLEQHHRFRHRAGLPHSKITAEEMKRVLDGRAEAAGDRENEGEDGEWRMEDGSSQEHTSELQSLR